MKRFGIRRQVALLTLIPSLIMVVSLEAFFLYSRSSDLDQGLLERGKLIAHQLASSSEYGVFSNNQAFLQNIANGVLHQPDVRGLVILDSASETLISAGKFSGSLNNMNEAVNLPAPLRSSAESLWIYQPIISAQVALDESDNKPDIQQIGAVIVEMSRLRTEGLKTRMLRVTVIVTALFLVFSLYLVSFASRGITSPIRKLSKAMRAIGAGNLDTRISLQTHVDELDTLAQGLNKMTAQLQHEHEEIRTINAELEQRVIQRTAQLESANADLESFSYSVSHDLRAPLRAIDGFVAILREEYASKLDEEGLRLFNVVGDNARKMGQLIDDILAFSRASRGELLLTRIDMNALVRQVWQELEPQRAGRAIEFRLADLPAAGGDLAAMRQVLQNLLDNAIKFTCERELAVIEVDGHTDGEENIYSIRDNGAGFDMAYIDKLFGLFLRLHGMDEFKGTGVGLAIVRRFIMKQGGRVWAKGKPGEGATFWFTLPLVDAYNEKKELENGERRGG
ncbi:MAG: hypothetical protein A3F73_12300 [Gallionellales bacterium RIFCSPLOWO2_12_FULL_59_22]|nr:MAG: hypothetical protein A3H99_03230 [Gallionellales bacterium RIFCSPLOWO2_02_FULL_59_110]OGT05502.1 MAG: hypothetical protein A2Z65_03805 [Gallionellales bacterium RIFCSPLOWO2_02_58_13]OGT13904.1 MAG: hypothetical protein A3F73_12300 [Gallionellales bacterium RIFCSPLOWO2_12_FULL_59_22]